MYICVCQALCEKILLEKYQELGFEATFKWFKEKMEENTNCFRCDISEEEFQKILATAKNKK